MGRIHSFRCVSCGRTFPPAEEVLTCPGCGPLLGTLDVEIDLPSPDRGKRNGVAVDSLWDFLDFLPVASPEPTADRFPGGTPLLPSAALARILGVA